MIILSNVHLNIIYICVLWIFYKWLILFLLSLLLLWIVKYILDECDVMMMCLRMENSCETSYLVGVIRLCTQESGMFTNWYIKDGACSTYRAPILIFIYIYAVACSTYRATVIMIINICGVLDVSGARWIYWNQVIYMDFSEPKGYMGLEVY